MKCAYKAMEFGKNTFFQKPLYIVIYTKILTLDSGWSSIILLKSSVYLINSRSET
jgi:hypothetical protein